jgi:hypothetical protein
VVVQNFHLLGMRNEGAALMAQCEKILSHLTRLHNKAQQTNPVSSQTQGGQEVKKKTLKKALGQHQQERP